MHLIIFLAKLARQRWNYTLLITLFPISALCNSLQPHEHTGILKPHISPPDFQLTTHQKKRLESGKPVYIKMLKDKVQNGVVIFRVSAPVDIVWSTILSFESYPKWIKNIQSIHIYEKDNNYSYIQFTAKHWLLGKTVWHVKHDISVSDKHDWLSWTLDYRYKSYFDDSVGFWQVKPVINQPNSSDVIYSANLQFKNSLPSFIESRIAKTGLKQATRWVKKQSEHKYLSLP